MRAAALFLSLLAPACAEKSTNAQSSSSSAQPTGPSIRQPSVVAEQNGLRLTAFVVDEPARTLVHVELASLSRTDLVVLEPWGAPATIWGSSGFVLEKRSSDEEMLWAAQEAGCLGPVLPLPAFRLAPEETWKSDLELPMLVQSWSRRRPPARRPKAELRPENLDALVVLTRVRVKVFAPRELTVDMRWGGFPEEFTDPEIPSVELELKLSRPLFVLQPDAGPTGPPPAITICDDFANRRPSTPRH